MIPVAISESEIEAWEYASGDSDLVIATFKRPVGFHALARIALNGTVYRVMYIDKKDKRDVWLQKIDDFRLT